jgi:hypothetical protein
MAEYLVQKGASIHRSTWIHPTGKIPNVLHKEALKIPMSVLDCAKATYKFAAATFAHGIGWTKQGKQQHILEYARKLDAKRVESVNYWAAEKLRKLDVRKKVTEKESLQSLMETAVMMFDFEEVNRLVDQGAHIDQEVSCGHTALTMAAGRATFVKSPDGQNMLSVDLLLDRKEKRPGIGMETSMGHTAMTWASHCGKPEVVDTLLDHGAEINQQLECNGRTALIIAASNGKSNVVRLLLERGADVTICDHAGKTAIQYAHQFNFVGVLQKMHEWKAGYFGDAKVEGMSVLEIIKREETENKKRVAHQMKKSPTFGVVESFGPDDDDWEGPDDQGDASETSHDDEDAPQTNVFRLFSTRLSNLLPILCESFAEMGKAAIKSANDGSSENLRDTRRRRTSSADTLKRRSSSTDMIAQEDDYAAGITHIFKKWNSQEKFGKHVILEKDFKTMIVNVMGFDRELEKLVAMKEKGLVGELPPQEVIDRAQWLVLRYFDQDKRGRVAESNFVEEMVKLRLEIKLRQVNFDVLDKRFVQVYRDEQTADVLPSISVTKMIHQAKQQPYVAGASLSSSTSLPSLSSNQSTHDPKPKSVSRSDVKEYLKRKKQRSEKNLLK